MLRIGELGQDFRHLPGTVSERIRLHAHSFLHGDKQVRQWHVLVKRQVLTVLVSHVLAPRQDQRIIRIVMSLAVAASIKQARVIQHRSIALFHLAKSLDQVPQAGCLVAIPLALVFRTCPLASAMG